METTTVAPSEAGIISEPQTINVEHPALEQIKKVAEIRHDKFSRFTNESFANVSNALSVYDIENRPKLRRDDAPEYKAASVIALEQPPLGSRVGVVFFSGALGTSSGDIHIPAEIMLKTNEARANERAAGATAEITPQLAFATALTSSVGKDIANSQNWVDILTHKSHVETAAYQAAFLLELLKEHPCDELVIIGHSLGTQEASYARPLLEKLLEINKIDTKIVGSILVHPNGLFKQDTQQFIKGLKEYQFPFLIDEVREMFPSLIDIYGVKAELDRAREGYDAGLTMRKNQELVEMRSKYANPRNLSPEQIEVLSDIDNQIEEIYFKEDKNRQKKLDKLLKRRYSFLMPITKDWLQTADPRKNEGDSLKSRVAMARVTALRREGSSIRPMPDWVADKQKGEVDIILGSDDHFFPENIALLQLSEMEAKKKRELLKEDPEATKEDLEIAGRYFPQADRVNIARIADWAHHVPATNAPKFGEIMTDVIRRMYLAKSNHVQSDTYAPQARQTLYY